MTEIESPDDLLEYYERRRRRLLERMHSRSASVWHNLQLRHESLERLTPLSEEIRRDIATRLGPEALNSLDPELAGELEDARAQLAEVTARLPWPYTGPDRVWVAFAAGVVDASIASFVGIRDAHVFAYARWRRSSMWLVWAAAVGYSALRFDVLTTALTSLLPVGIFAGMLVLGGLSAVLRPILGVGRIGRLIRGAIAGACATVVAYVTLAPFVARLSPEVSPMLWVVVCALFGAVLGPILQPRDRQTDVLEAQAPPNGRLELDGRGEPPR